MGEGRNTETVKEIYADFGRGDVDGILSKCSDDVLWLTHLDPVVPWSGNYSGKNNVRTFFEAIFTSVDVEAFEPMEWIADGDKVVSIGRFVCVARSTGKRADTRWVFIWRFHHGMVNSYEQFHDESISDAFRA
jgi:ketosteroid isomerase-like protein